MSDTRLNNCRRSRPATPRAASRRPASIELLEMRQYMSVAPTSATESIDGTGNNLANPAWGSTGVDLLRHASAAYGDRISSPAGANRPSARVISNAVDAALSDGKLNDRNLSAFVYAWGQFLDHDMDLTPGGSPTQAFNITVPAGDPYFDPTGTGSQLIYMSRSTYDAATGTSTANPRQQVNTITAWIDGSVVYGCDATRAAALRTFVGGLLKTSAGNLLPFNTAALPNANDAHILPDSQLFLAGDVRANENIELSSLQTLFVREHNRLARAIAAQNPGQTDERIYQHARRIVIGEIQAITYNEFIPALMGANALTPYRGYNPRVNPGISNEFSTAAYRIGHTMLGDDIEFLDNNGNAVRSPVALANAFFNPTAIEQVGIDPLLKYLASDRMQEVDTQLVDSVRNFLFGPPGAGGFDLASLNIQRGRDHGVADYNSTRAAYGLPRVTSFSQITSDTKLAVTLQSLYGSVDNIDLWVGGLAEDHVAGTSVGPLFRTIMADQFQRLRDADRFWYQNTLSGADLSLVQGSHLADIIRPNSGVTNVQDNVFVFNVTFSGTVFSDPNLSHHQEQGEVGLGGWTIQLLDSTGAVVATTTTTRDGHYTFTNLDLGTYKIHCTAPTTGGWRATTPDTQQVNVTRGVNLLGLDFGFVNPNNGYHDPVGPGPIPPPPPVPPPPPPPPPAR